ncbi:MAG: hypothetical protein EA383_07045 [Spirochaetaceae bacterium]|nr:MAG: hypothetical protein EA383_07045 [Spirochaetaceae bacterium]
MEALTLQNVVRKDIPLAYRRTYTASAVVSGRNTGESIFGIEFDIEHTPLGTVEVQVRFPNRPSYPLVPLIKRLKETITALEREGSLP